MKAKVVGERLSHVSINRTLDVYSHALPAMQKAATEKLENSFSDHELKDGRVIRLDTPKYLYEADLLNGNKVGEIVITPEGQVTEGPEWIVRPL